MTKPPLCIGVLGASYGLLPAIKLALAGHRVAVVGRQTEIVSIAATGAALYLPARETGEELILTVPAQVGGIPVSGALTLLTPDLVQPRDFDLVILAMQEPQYTAPEIAALMTRIAQASVPCLSIMNMPPLPFLVRLGIGNADTLAMAYSAASVWAGFDPALITLASPDPQAFRPDPEQPGRLCVTLPSNFKVAPFADPAHQAMLTRVAADIDALRVGPRQLTPRVRFIAHASALVPMAKWPMLLVGNCRCLTEDGVRSIADAVWADVAASRRLYDWVADLTIQLGASPSDLVPFARYAAAARQLSLPSSLARGLTSGGCAVERYDLLVQRLANGQNATNPQLTAIIDRIDAQLLRNRRAAVA